MSKYDIETCRKLAAECSSRTEFNNRYRGAYDAARVNGWLNDICKHMGKRTNAPTREGWSKTDYLLEALQYKTLKEYRINHPFSYVTVRQKGWADHVTGHMTRSRTHDKWDRESVAREAKKYSVREAFRHGSSGAYDFAIRNDILDEVCRHMRRPAYYKYSPDGLAKMALKYKTRTEFARKDSGGYYSAIRQGILDDICKHMPKNASRKKTRL